jgi:hypothetical protein
MQMLFRTILMALLLVAPAGAQEFRATVTGRVTDPSGAPVPAVQIRATNIETNVSTETISTETGDYSLPFLQPGSYRIEAEGTGFKKFVRDGVTLRVADRLAIPVTLELGPVSESVTVTGDAPLLETTNGSSGEVISGQMLVDMPLNGRNAYMLVGMVPGALPTGRGTPAFFERTTSNNSTSALSISGGAEGFNEVTLDGVSMTGGNNKVTYIPSTDATQQFKVQTNAFDAELGRFVGGLVNATTKAGTNQWHGALFEFHRNSALNARDFFATEKPAFQYNQFGLSIGGPVRVPKAYNGHNRTFFFFNYEGSREGVARSWVSTVPTDLQRKGDFSQTYTRLTNREPAAITIYDPQTTRTVSGALRRDPFPGNVIPANRFDPVALQLLAFYPLPNAVSDPITNVNNLRLAYKDPVYDNGYVVRVDHHISSRHQIFGRYSWRHFYVGRQSEFKSMATGDSEDRYAPGVALDDTLTLNSTTVLNFRYGFSRLKSQQRSDSLGYDVEQLGFPAYLKKLFVVQAIPAISISGFTGFSQDNKLSENAQDTHSVKASAAKQVGRHMLRAGFEGRLLRSNVNSVGSDAAGSYKFDTTYTRGPNPNASSQTAGNGMASFLLGGGSSGSAAMNDSTAVQMPYYALYLQNDLRMTSRLSVNLGVRNEWEGAQTERFNRFNRGFAFDTPNPLEQAARANYAQSPIAEIPVDRFRVMGGLLFAGVNGQPRALSNFHFLNMGPRVGVAYAIGRKTVIRGGYGIFYGATTSLATTSVGFGTSTPWVATIDNGLTVVNPLSNPFPNGLLKAPASSDGLLSFVGQGISFVDVDRRMLTVHQFQAGIQRELPGKLLVDASYSGSRGRGLPLSHEIDATPDQFRRDARQVYLATGRNILNESVPNPFYGLISSGSLAGRNTTRGQLVKPYPQFTSINERNSDIGSSGYNSFQLKVAKRLSNGLSLLAAYTNSKLLRNMSFLNNSDPQPTRALADYDIPQRLTISGGYELPFGRGKRLLNRAPTFVQKLAAGWKVNGIYTAQSGIPLSVSAETVGRSAKLPKSQQTIDHWFDTSAFRQRATLELVATSKLPDVRSQGRNNFDASLHKGFSITEKWKAQIRAEAFNMFNRTEFDVPSTSLGSNFGVIRAQNNFARQLQFGLKLLW